jgi:succinoglycan biosynthesis transport protein ExoP
LSDNASAVVNKFSDLYKAYTQAQIERIKVEANYRELKDLKIDSLPQFVNNRIIQDLQTDYTRMKSEYDEKSKLFKSNYPEMVQLKTRLDSMREGLENEIKKAVDVAESEYRSALKKETSIKNLLAKQKDDMATMDSNAILYNNIKVEVENMRKLLNSLVERQKETVVSAGLGGLNTSNISIIDKGEIPKNPASPKKKFNLILAFLFGIFGGTGLCFFFEYLDNSVKGPEDVEKLAGLPSLGVIPYFNPEDTKNNKKYGYYSRRGYSHEKENPGSEVAMPKIKEIELINHLYPKFFLSEDYRTLRTSILLSHAESSPKAIVFSSALPKEGKTATVVNMAVAFSQLDKKVLIIDADLRKPRLHKVFKIRNLHGLSGCLIGMESFEDAIHQTSVKNIWLLPTGLIPPNPAELLNSKKMKELIEEVKKKFDIILIDSTPVLAVIDAVIISSLADSVVLVIKPGGVTRKAFMSAVEELKRSKVKIIGTVFNGVNMKKGDYSFMNYYHYYRYYYYEEEGKRNKTQQIQ